MTLRSSLRSGGSAPISLFAFQDIIFAATGIFLLIAILMTLFGKVDLLSTEELAESTELREELKLLTERQAIAEKKLQVLEAATLFPKSQSTETSNAAGELNRTNPWLYEIDSLSELNKKLRLNTDADFEALSNKALEMNRQEIRLELLQSGGYQNINDSGQAIIRKGAKHDFREPIFVTLDQSGFMISYPSRPDLKQEFKSQQVLLKYIQATFDASAQNFLIFLKPSGIKHFDPLKKWLRSMNYQIGYEPVAENFELQ